ncbi:MAG: hypothetical protein JXQ82_07865 [Methanomicrobiaceae archaeon]|nr:hypothetical protein [Methanomicrobiaceae archaeon]
MTKVTYPCTFTKKVDDDGDTFWRGEQKQLDILIEECSFTDCVSELERTMKKVFRKMTGSDSMDHLIHCQQTAVKGVVSFKIPVNRTLTEFVSSAVDNDAEEDPSDLPDVNEINMAALAALEAANEREILDDRELECDYRATPELEGGIEALPEWSPKPGDRVIYSNPFIPMECGLFIVSRPVFNDEKDLPEEYCIISQKGKENTEIRKRELKSRLKLGPEKPCAKFCKDRACNYYQPRECSGVHECNLTGLTPSYSNLCPRDEEKLTNNQFQQIAEFLADTSPEYSEKGGITDES